MYEENIDVSITECTNCKTDEYLMEIETVEMTRDQIIKELINDELQACIADEYLEQVLYTGIVGYKDFSNDDLVSDWNNNIGESKGQTAKIVN